MAFSPGASSNYIFCAKKDPFLALGLSLRLGEGREGAQGSGKS